MQLSSVFSNISKFSPYYTATFPLNCIPKLYCSSQTPPQNDLEFIGSDSKGNLYWYDGGRNMFLSPPHPDHRHKPRSVWQVLSLVKPTCVRFFYMGEGVGARGPPEMPLPP